MGEHVMTKPEVVELVSIIYRRKRMIRDLEEEVQLCSWHKDEAEKMLKSIPKEYQNRYDEIVQEFKKNLENLSNEIIEKEFVTCEPLEE